MTVFRFVPEGISECSVTAWIHTYPGIGTEPLYRKYSQFNNEKFVENDETGDRSFSFYRNPGAVMMLRADEDCEGEWSIDLL